MKMKKIFAAMAATAVTASAFAAMSLSANAAAVTYPESITVMVAGGWGSYTGTWTDATDDNSITITENGTYTITVPSGEAGELTEGSWAMAIRTTNFTAFDYGDEGDDFDACLQKGGVNLTVDSVKIGDAEKKIADSVVRNDDDGNNMRVNIYNQWTSPAVAIVDGNQVFDADVSVTFTVSGLKFGDQATEPTEAPATTTADGGSAATTTKADDSKATTTKAADSKTTTTKAASGTSTETSAQTGDVGVAVAVAALGLAAATAFVVRKKD